MTKLLSRVLAALCVSPIGLFGHCQMPCGIYHDDNVYGQIDQYIETMYKAVSEINANKFETVKEKSQFVRWVYQKEKQSSEAADLITTYFLQQKIKPGEDDTSVKSIAAQKLLFLMVQIKQSTDIKLVNDFKEEWDKFKHLFHREGYECQMEMLKLKKWEEEGEKLKDGHAHEHDHAHE